MPVVDFARLFRAIGIRGAIAIALAIALGVVMWRADSISQSREKLRNEYAAETARHAVTRQSVETLIGELQRMVEEGEARRERVADAMMQAAEDTAPLRQEAERIEREGLGSDYADRLREAGI
mgnify:CR=1 FL=1